MKRSPRGLLWAGTDLCVPTQLWTDPGLSRLESTYNQSVHSAWPCPGPSHQGDGPRLESERQGAPGVVPGSHKPHTQPAADWVPGCSVTAPFAGDTATLKLLQATVLKAASSKREEVARSFAQATFTF
jgi:hypothetical protein